jgi:hypothetical protein
MATTRRSWRPGAAALALVLVAALGGSGLLLAACGPFTDVGTLICPFVLELYYSGITAGTSSTTFSPNNPVTRGQMAVFTSTALDLSLARSSRRAALGQWWTTTPQFSNNLGTTNIGAPYSLNLLASDGADIWVPYADSVARVRGSDGALLGTWTGAPAAYGALIAMGRVFVAGNNGPGDLYMIDPTQPPGSVTTVASNLGNNPFDIAFDGTNIWTANDGAPGSVSIITPGSTLPWAVTTVTTGFNSLIGIVFDGSNMWVTDQNAGKLLKLDAAGNIMQTVTVGTTPKYPVFDGRNIWVPNLNDGTVTVVAASSGAVLATLSGNGLLQPMGAAFDGQRIVITNFFGGNVSIWKAADLTPIGYFPAGTAYGACSDGVNFWLALWETGQIGRF